MHITQGSSVGFCIEPKKVISWKCGDIDLGSNISGYDSYTYFVWGVFTIESYKQFWN